MTDVSGNTSAGIENPVPQAGADNSGAANVAAMLYGNNKPDNAEQTAPQEQTQPDQAQADTQADAQPNDNAQSEESTETAQEENKEGSETEITPEIFKEYVDLGVLNETSAQALAEIAKEQGFSPEQAKILAELQVSNQRAALEAVQESIANWENQVKEDPEIGGDKLQESLAVAKRGVEALGIDGLMDWLDSTGLGSHPLVIKVLYKVGQMTAEAPTVKGKDSAERDARSIAEKLYKTG